MKLLLKLLPFVVMPLVLCGCAGDDEDFEKVTGLEEFIPIYNKYIKEWVAEQLKETEEGIAKAEEELGKATDDAARKHQEELLKGLKETKEAMEFRRGLGDYFAFKSPEDIPEGLVWENGLDQPELGDPAAKEGGVFRFYFEGFDYPSTLREFGLEASGTGFRGEIYDNVQVGLVRIHPTTGGIMPGVASEWAEGPDGRTVFYRIDPDARYADGTKPIMEDFFRAVWVRVSDYVVEPYGKQYFREQMAQFAIYDERTISISLPNARPLLPYYACAGGIEPASAAFFKDYGPDYEERYNWRVAPTCGAYIVKDEDVKKGLSVTLTRVENWWGDKKKFYQYRYNPEKIIYTLVRDRSKAWELFRAGEIDYFRLTEPYYWYEQSEMPPVFDGYVEKWTWYNQYPRPPRGLYINTYHKPLDSLAIRKGIHHACNWQKVIDVVHRGDYQRLPGWAVGYGRYHNSSIKAREYSETKAREYFAKGGYTKRGEDGILRNEAGEKLEVPITYIAVPVLEKMMVIIKEEGRKAGIDFILEPLDGSVLSKVVADKKHKMLFYGFASTPPLPRYFEILHSRNAYDEKGNLKIDTNNLMSFADEEVDQLCEAYRNATDLDVVKRIGDQLQQIMHDEALIVPAYMTEYERFGCWRWVRWPDTEEVEVAPPGFYVPFESYCFWVDQDVKEETLEARRTGKTFPEVQEVADMFRTKPNGGGSN